MREWLWVYLEFWFSFSVFFGQSTTTSIQAPFTIYGIAIVIVVGGFLLLKGFGVDKATKDFYKWARDYSPPSLPMQISNYTVIAGILCIAVSVYLGCSKR